MVLTGLPGTGVPRPSSRKNHSVCGAHGDEAGLHGNMLCRSGQRLSLQQLPPGHSHLSKEASSSSSTILITTANYKLRVKRTHF